MVEMESLERLADQHFIRPHCVEITGVEQGDASNESGVDGGDAPAAVGRAVEIRHAHAAEADGRDGWTCRAEFALFHDGSPRNRAADVSTVMTRLICALSYEAISWTIINSLFIISNNEEFRPPRPRCVRCRG